MTISGPKITRNRQKKNMHFGLADDPRPASRSKVDLFEQEKGLSRTKNKNKNCEGFLNGGSIGHFLVAQHSKKTFASDA